MFSNPFGLISLPILGHGSPEGAVYALPGTIYLNDEGGDGATLWVKESGNGNTGWVAYAKPYDPGQQ